MNLETPRLTLIPLNAEQLAAYIEPEQALENMLGVPAGPRPVSERVRQAVLTRLLPALHDPATNWLLHTFWLGRAKQSNRLVAELCFKGAPNAAGELEIGYATYPGFERQGFMTEAVAALSAWALTQPGITAVLAQTAPSNLASHRVLAKTGFIRQSQTAANSVWRRSPTAV